jgi:hypothetical protein
VILKKLGRHFTPPFRLQIDWLKDFTMAKSVEAQIFSANRRFLTEASSISESRHASASRVTTPLKLAFWVPLFFHPRRENHGKNSAGLRNIPASSP